MSWQTNNKWETDFKGDCGVITKAKSPAVQLLDVPQDYDRASKVVELMLPVWNAMKAGVDFASPSPMSCSTCPFQSRCPAHYG